MAPIQIAHITFEHHTTGFGIGHARPRISWSFDGGEDTKSWTQQSYEIQIGHPNADPVTYKVQSSQSVLVPWPSRDLLSRESAWVKVRSHGKGKTDIGNIVDESTDWSHLLTVEAALLQKGDWTAKLITSTLIPNKKESIRPMRFRRIFSIPEGSKKILKARLYITAHGVYESFLNGRRVGDEEMAPGWTSYNHRLIYQTFDITESLTAGELNVIGVEVAEGWFSGRLGMEGQRCFYGERIGFLAQLEITFEDDRSYTLISDHTWKSHKSAITRSEIYDGEDYDSREEQSGWNAGSTFDESSWLPTEELPFQLTKLESSDTPPVRKKEELSPIKIFESESGKALLDFGQNLVGKLQVRLPVSQDPEKSQVSFSHAEVLENGELGVRPLRGARPIDRVVLSNNQPSTWSPKFTFHGFRYVQVDGWPSESGLPGPDDIKALVLYSDMRRIGWFSCSDPLINKMHENVCWSMKGNFFSLPTDCPQRDERLGWTGDIQVFGPSANFLFDTQGFLGSWLRDVAVEQLQEGKDGVPGLVVPDIFNPPHPPGPQSIWHDVTVLTPWDCFYSSGDLEILKRQYSSMKAWVGKGIKYGPNGLWDQNVWQFGDWLDPAAPPSEPASGRTDSTLIADAYLVRVLDTLCKVSTLLGENEDAARYSKDAANTRKAFQHEYIAPSGLLVGDTQTALSLAISFGLFENKNHIQKAARRLCHLVHAARYRIATGFAGTPIITHALSDTGNHQLAYRMLLEQKCPSWLYPITMGATTIWERWDSMLPDGSINPGEMTSFNHYALGSVANWLHKNVGGISPLEPGWRMIKVRPVPGGTITSADVAYESPYGRITCSWNLDEAKRVFNLTVIVPSNSNALVILPSEWAGEGPDGEEKGTRIGSGKYTFSEAYKSASWPPVPEFERSNFRVEV